MNARTGRCTRRPAFTLIEVVVALALGVTLLVAVQGLVVQAYRTGVQIEGRAARDATRMLPFVLLRQDLTNRPTTGGLWLQNGVLSFTTLNAMQSARVAPRHAVSVRYACERTGDGASRLLRREAELGRDDRAGAAVVLADGIAAATIDVFDGQSWHDRWPLRVARQARAVRIKLTWSSGKTETQIIRLAPLRWRRHDG
jgi:prepilin-type N-terminal cleavage/methylation domain-containing protein